MDIRVCKPAAAEKARAPQAQPCDHVNCPLAGEHRAPKSRERANEYWHFCREHAADYNRRWNYFDGMSEDDFVNFQRGEEIGHRPVWTFRPARGERVSASRFWKAAAPGDGFNLFGRKEGAKPAAPRRPRLSRLQILALEALSLEEDAAPQAIRARYAELVKRWHPDSNGGDRSTESLLQKAVAAYQTLKQAGLA